MSELSQNQRSYEHHEHYPVSDDLQFAMTYALKAGKFIMVERKNLVAHKKPDRTDVTEFDIAVNKDFELHVAHFTEGRASVIGEESSSLVAGSHEVWIIDPIDGTGEYIDESLSEHERTSCVAIALFKDGRPQLSVVYNPFRDELFYADKDLGGAYLNGRRLDLKEEQNLYTHLTPNIPYDYCHWDNAQVDARFLEKMLGRPIGSYSAIYQACMVAKGESAFAIFPGDTLHDIAPATLLVELAGGIVTSADGNPLTLANTKGAVYARNPTLHQEVITALAASQEK